jgi:hypothetical protein
MRVKTSVSIFGLATPAIAMAIDLVSLWDFSRPEVSEQ